MKYGSHCKVCKPLWQNRGSQADLPTTFRDWNRSILGMEANLKVFRTCLKLPAPGSRKSKVRGHDCGDEGRLQRREGSSVSLFFELPRHITLSEARSRLYQRRFLRANSHFSAFFKIYKIFTILPRSNLKIFENFVKNFVILKKNQKILRIIKISKVNFGRAWAGNGSRKCFEFRCHLQISILAILRSSQQTQN